MQESSGPMDAAAVTKSGPVAPGCTVRVRDADGEHEHRIVTRLTAGAPLECVSVASPVGRALLGRRHGEQVHVHTPDGVRLLTIVDVTDLEEVTASSGDRACEE
jgi:transcription elongation GreA/GreB family factor